MKHRLSVAFAAALLSVGTMSAQEQLLAFPGAEGFGRYATGGRGGMVYHVTNLNDSGEGSFRDAVSQPNRIVVFDVGGVIRPKSAISFANNLTIAGQTAPGEGIIISGERISISNRSNIICRYLRVRYGVKAADGKDAMGISEASHTLIFDHLSVSWGRDENFSINSTSAYDITIQNSIIGQGLQNHSCGGLIQTDINKGVTLYRNLYIDNKTRNPKVKGLNQFVNNVVYNWGNGAAYNMGGDSGGSSNTHIENNYFIVGPVKNYENVRIDPSTIAYGQLVPMNPTKPFIGGNERFNTYCVGNVYDNDKDGILGGTIITEANWHELCDDTASFLGSVPEVMPVIGNMMSAGEAYEWIVAHCGASLPVRDEVDEYLIGELTSLGTLGTIIQDETNEEQFPIGGIGDFRHGEPLPDSDGDGMPDIWEDANGTDKDVDDAMEVAANGYANIENYINSIDAPQPFVGGPKTMKGSAKAEEITLQWSSRQNREIGYAVEMLNADGEWEKIETEITISNNLTVTGLEPETSYSFRIKALYADDLESDYSDVLTISTRTLPSAPQKTEPIVPADGSILNVAESQSYTLSWKNVTNETDHGQTTYLLFFGADANDMTELNNGAELRETSFVIDIDANATYYWRVDAVNAQGLTEGDVWSFSTQRLTEQKAVLYLPFDGNLKNEARKARELALEGIDVDAEAEKLTEEYAEGIKNQSFVFPLATEATKTAGLRVPYYEGLNIVGEANNVGGTTVYDDPAGSFTVSLWLKSNGTFFGSAYIWHKGNWNTPRWVGAEVRSGTLYYVAKRGSNKQEIKVLTSSSTPTFAEIFDNTWHHLVFVRDHAESKMMVYIDGELVNNSGISKCKDYPMNSDDGFTIGNSMESGKNDEPFTGALDEVRLYNAALSASEASNLYQTGTTSGQETGLHEMVLAGEAVVHIVETKVYDALTIAADELQQNIEMKIVSLGGKTLISRYIAKADGMISIDGLSALAPGIYVVVVKTDNGVVAKRICKM